MTLGLHWGCTTTAFLSLSFREPASARLRLAKPGTRRVRRDASRLSQVRGPRLAYGTGDSQGHGEQPREAPVPRELVGPANRDVPLAMFSDDRLQPDAHVRRVCEVLALDDLGIVAHCPDDDIGPGPDSSPGSA